ncbi:hypothetical protein SLE2022_347590 [Rubroshorea leprosula]
MSKQQITTTELKCTTCQPPLSLPIFKLPPKPAQCQHLSLPRQIATAFHRLLTVEDAQPIDSLPEFPGADDLNPHSQEVRGYGWDDADEVFDKTRRRGVGGHTQK